MILRLLLKLSNFYISLKKQLTNDGRNLLSYASFIVGYIELNEETRSKDYLQRFSNHFSGPFMVH